MQRQLMRIFVVESIVAIILLLVGETRIALAAEENQSEVSYSYEYIPIEETVDYNLNKQLEQMKTEGNVNTSEEVIEVVAIEDYEEEAVEVVNYTKEDVELLANIMYLEEGIYADREQGEYVHKLAGSVVLHRVNCPTEFGNTIEEVLYEPGQYASRTKNLIGQVEIPEKVYTWAEDILRDGPIGPETMYFQAQFKQGKGTFYHYGNQYFCYN